MKAFEQAEAEDDPNQRQDFLTFVLVGAGPTGVELASLLAVLVRTSLRAEFRLINLAATRVVLVDMAPRVLGYFRFRTLRGGQGPGGKSWSGSAVGHSVDRIDADGAVIGGKRIASKVVIWTAGVAPSPVWWVAERGDGPRRPRWHSKRSHGSRSSRHICSWRYGFAPAGEKPLPGVAQVAIQQRRYAGRRIAQSLFGKPSSRPFRYFDKGNIAVIGAGLAILQAGRVRLSGIVARLASEGIHLQFLSTTSLRLSVLLQWTWRVF